MVLKNKSWCIGGLANIFQIDLEAPIVKGTLHLRSVYKASEMPLSFFAGVLPLEEAAC